MDNSVKVMELRKKCSSTSLEDTLLLYRFLKKKSKNTDDISTVVRMILVGDACNSTTCVTGF